MSSARVPGLPLLPGSEFRDPTKADYRRGQTLNYRNGYSIPKVPISATEMSQAEIDELASFQPHLTYGQAKQAPPEDFIPSFVAFDKKVLRFYGYFKETVHESPSEYYRVRPIAVYYFLEDDTIAVHEPEVANSGMPQGRLIRRQRVPKNDVGDFYSWKDINLQQSVTFYGRTFRICDCDPFTRDYLTSEGIEVNSPEEVPKDSYSTNRQKKEEPRNYKTPADFDKLRQFLENDRKVLRFFAAWDDRENMFGEKRKFIIQYYLVDDTLEVREAPEANSGRDPFPQLIRRHKVAKDRFNLPPSFPSITLEISDNETKEYFKPADFRVGQTVNIYGREFYLYDCDNFTRAFYYHNFGVTNFEAQRVDETPQLLPKMEIPPYNGFGSIEDSLQSCLKLVPEPAKKDYIKMMQHDHTTLRYEAMLDSIRTEDAHRRFVISFHLSDDTITIHEPPVKNSGIIGGKFLARSRIAKPGGSTERHDYYGPDDLQMGSTVEVFGHRFVITGADLFVLKFMEENPQRFSPEAIAKLRSCLGPDGAAAHERAKDPIQVKRREGDVPQLLAEMKRRMKGVRITGANEMRKLFLKYDRERTGTLDRESVTAICRQLNLPLDTDLIDGLMTHLSNGQGRIRLEDFERFLDSATC